MCKIAYHLFDIILQQNEYTKSIHRKNIKSKRSDHFRVNQVEPGNVQLYMIACLFDGV